MFTATVEKAKKAGLIQNDGDVFRVELDQIRALEGMNPEMEKERRAENIHGSNQTKRT